MPDELMMPALDAGAEDFSEEEDSYEVITASGRFLCSPRGAGEGWRPDGGSRRYHDSAELGRAYR